MINRIFLLIFCLFCKIYAQNTIENIDFQNLDDLIFIQIEAKKNIEKKDIDIKFLKNSIKIKLYDFKENSKKYYTDNHNIKKITSSKINKYNIIKIHFIDKFSNLSSITKQSIIGNLLLLTIDSNKSAILSSNYIDKNYLLNQRTNYAIIFILLLLFIFIIIKFFNIKNTNFINKKYNNMNFKVISYLSLGYRQKILLISIGFENILLSISGNNISYIKNLDNKNNIFKKKNKIIEQKTKKDIIDMKKPSFSDWMDQKKEDFLNDDYFDKKKNSIKKEAIEDVTSIIRSKLSNLKDV